MQSPTLTWSRFVYLAGLVLALVLFIPVASFPTQIGKISLFAVCLALSALMLVWGGGIRTLVRSHGFYAALLVGLLPVVYLLSTLTSADSTVGWVGYALDGDTVFFTTLACVAFVLAFVHFRTLRTVRLLMLALGGALGVAALFQFISIIFGVPIPGIDDRSVNLIGKWNDLGLLVGLLALLLLVRAELGETSGNTRILTTVGLVVLLVLLAFINFALVWALLLVGGLMVAGISYLSMRGTGSMPVLSGVVVAAAGLFLIFGATFSVAITSLFPVSSLEVRPGAATTFDITSKAYDGSFSRFLLGSGPNTFAQQWMLHKPAEVNQTEFWSLDFNVGFSTLTTALMSVGFLGLIAWLTPLGLVLAGVARVVRGSILTAEARSTAVSVALAVLFAYAALAFYVPSPNLILLAFVLSGAAFGFLWRQGRESLAEAPLRRVEQVMMLLIIVVLIAVSVWTAVTSMRRLTASIYIGQGQVALSAGDIAGALAAATASGRVEESSTAMRLATDVGVVRLGEISQETTPSPSLQAEFVQLAQDTLARGMRAVALAPADYRNYVSLGAAYTLLASVGVDGAYKSAQDMYVEAAKRNPTNPTIPLFAARLEAGQQNYAQTQKHIEQALTIKSNYTDAMLFAVQLAVAQNDVVAAVRAAEAAARTAPGVSPIWFQLGLLHYAAGNMDAAIPALERALALTPDYANAKYFLGVAYYTKDRKNEGLALFEDLYRTNPESQEVSLILGNMRGGRPALEGLPTTQPTEAPVAE